MAGLDARRTYAILMPVGDHIHVTCPNCDERVYMKATLETDDPRFFSKSKSATDIAEDVEVLMELHGYKDKGLWGKPTDKRSMVLACYKPPFIHYKVNNRSRLIYLKRLW